MEENAPKTRKSRKGIIKKKKGRNKKIKKKRVMVAFPFKSLISQTRLFKNFVHFTVTFGYKNNIIFNSATISSILQSKTVI